MVIVISIKSEKMLVADAFNVNQTDFNKIKQINANP